MATVIYSVCAAIGGTILVCQFVMSILGLAGHEVGDGDLGDIDVDHSAAGHDMGHDASGDHPHGEHTSTWFFGVITFQTVVAAMTLFGLAGLAAGTSGWNAGATFILALAAGAGAMFGVHSLMRALHKLRADGTVRIAACVGRPGTVYLRVPASRAGAGKVHVNVQNRSVEFEAVTSADELPSGARVLVVGVVGPETVEVAAVNESENTAHG